MERYIREIQRKNGVSYNVRFGINKIAYDKTFPTLEQAIEWRDNTLSELGRPMGCFVGVAKHAPNFNIEHDIPRKRFKINYMVEKYKKKEIFSYASSGDKEHALQQAKQRQEELRKAWKK